jgi:hypothetical protein
VHKKRTLEQKPELEREKREERRVISKEIKFFLEHYEIKKHRNRIW